MDPSIIINILNRSNIFTTFYDDREKNMSRIIHKWNHAKRRNGDLKRKSAREKRLIEL